MRERLADEITEAEVVIPPLRLCGDNAGMVSLAAAIEYDKGHFAGLDLNAKPAWLLILWIKIHKKTPERCCQEFFILIKTFSF